MARHTQTHTQPTLRYLTRQQQFCMGGGDSERAHATQTSPRQVLNQSFECSRQVKLESWTTSRSVTRVMHKTKCVIFSGNNRVDAKNPKSPRTAIQHATCSANFADAVHTNMCCSSLWNGHHIKQLLLALDIWRLKIVVMPLSKYEPSMLQVFPA